MVMQRTDCTNIDGARPAIGMGCASLGSRVGRREGLRALARAYDAGITWFDVAPSYGDAEAETILGEFVQGRPPRSPRYCHYNPLPATSAV